MGEVDPHSRQLVIRNTQEEAGGVRLSVQDTGKGLDPQSLDMLFEAFYTTKKNGMGMAFRSVARSSRVITAVFGQSLTNEGPGATFSFLFLMNPSA